MVKNKVLTPVLAGVLGLSIVGSGLGYYFVNKDSNDGKTEGGKAKLTQVADNINNTLGTAEKAIKGELDFAYNATATVSFGEGFTEEAQKLRNRVLYIDRDDVELDEGCYFVQDLIGLEVVDADSGESYGKITDVSQTGANDVYHIADEKGNVKLIPAIPEVVAETDIEGGIMKITPLEGLFD